MKKIKYKIFKSIFINDKKRKIFNMKIRFIEVFPKIPNELIVIFLLNCKKVLEKKIAINIICKNIKIISFIL
jgi:hypothetical protein